MTDEYYLNVSIRRAGGNASKGAVRGTLNIPKDIIKALRLTKDDNGIVLIHNKETNEITIRKTEKTIIL
ncbi:MAG: hypothetical protein ACI33J_03435 [Clostridium sp.]